MEEFQVPRGNGAEAYPAGNRYTGFFSEKTLILKPLNVITVDMYLAQVQSELYIPQVASK